MQLTTDVHWLDNLLPEGMTIPSSTLISGPGGTGKPLVGFAILSAWLRAGGSVIAMPLQYPNPELTKSAMSRLYNINLDDYRGNIVYIQFDPHAEKVKKVGEDMLKANMVKPEVWDETIERAEKMVRQSGPGTLVFGSALNLLLFSQTYQNSMLRKLEDILKNEKGRTYLFAVSTSALADKIKALEDAADNLMFTRIEKPGKLFFRIEKMKDLEFSGQETQVPIGKEMLDELSNVADSTRKTRIPEIRKI
jgi:KaiC/GvpD/RAD55 family RecA-like ATPase